MLTAPLQARLGGAYAARPARGPGMVTTTLARLHCGDKTLRRWRSVSDPNHITCWACWNCTPPPPGRMVDILALVRAEPRTLLAISSEAVDEHCFRDLAEFGAPIALELKPLPCRCRVCSPRASAQRLVGPGQRSAA